MGIKHGALVAGASNSGWATSIFKLETVPWQALGRSPCRAPALVFYFATPCRGAEGRSRKRCVVIKITKGKPPKAANHKEVHQPVVGEAEPRKA